MELTYYNFDTQIVANWWDRQRFVAHWWRFYKSDPFWVPPYYPLLSQSLNPKHNPHLARLNLLLARQLRRSNGGRNTFWRWWLKWADHQPAPAGRILYLAVLPEWRRRGIGRHLV
ncbi:MAG TPA: GNAT family N-acetyltransferase [Anaerolineae bacterium]|nr:GNAT family N-acetyltransferase [Anaerolineae bacterium]HRV91512.1 GNAT family N-acetyltransferase [Anaerolineae bacterium]